MTADLVTRVRRRAANDPKALAIADDDGCLSYGDLSTALNAAGRQLDAAGVVAGDLVEVRAERTGRLPVALLALWERAATAVIVDGRLPAAYQQNCSAAARPAWRLTLDGDPFVVTATGRPHARVVGSASHVLFSSGTTGRPAAVMVGRAAFGRAIGWYMRAFRATPTDRVALLSGLGHDPALRDMLVPLLAGGQLVVPPPDVYADPQRLRDFLGATGVTVLHATPALLELMLAADGSDLRRLRLVVCCGAALRAGLVRRLRQVTGAEIVHGYGATETPQLASAQVVAPEPAGRRVPDDTVLGVGRGVAGSVLLLVDPDGRPTGADAGEVLVRSPNLAIGYLPGTGRPGRFVADPRGRPGYRAYRTGDRGERDGDGGLRIVGRLDRQLSVNGLRIEPDEIERAALTHPAVATAVAGAVTGPAGDIVELVVTPAGPQPPDPRQLRAHLRDRLPGPAVPARIRVVARLGTDLNHKVRLP